MTTGLDLVAGGYASGCQFDGGNHVTGGRALVTVAPGRAFEIGEALVIAVAGDDVFSPVDRIAEADGFEGNINAAQLAGDGVAQAGDEGHGVFGGSAHFFDGGGIGGRDGHFEVQTGRFVESLSHHFTTAHDDVRVHGRNEQHFDGVFGGANGGHGFFGGRFCCGGGFSHCFGRRFRSGGSLSGGGATGADDHRDSDDERQQNEQIAFIHCFSFFRIKYGFGVQVPLTI